MNLNKVFLIGNLTRDPELRTLPSGKPVVSFGVATNRIWNDESGKRQQVPEFHNIVLFGKLAEIAKQYLSKGKMVFIEGRIQTRSWEGQDGSKKNRTEIIAERLQLGPRGGGAPAPAPAAKEEVVETIEYPHDEGEINASEIPF
ncbi:MAG: single-stranded DNA-binding protein [Candidatus Ryanbacteria bacterium]|nr:single-stranded DNA-binding protein [Candidatus Ryanbacteria bacterium]